MVSEQQHQSVTSRGACGHSISFLFRDIFVHGSYLKLFISLDLL